MVNQTSSFHLRTPKKRPFSVTLLTWVVLIITALGWLRLVEVIRRWEFLRSLSPAPPVLYLAVAGLVWGLLGAILVWGLFLGRFWAPRLMKITAVIYTLYYWFDRLWIANPSAIATRWLFALGLTIILLAFTFWIFSRSNVQNFFHREKN